MHYYALVCRVAISYAQMYVTSHRLLLFLSTDIQFSSYTMLTSIDWYLCAENFMHVDYDSILRDSKLSTCKFDSFHHWMLILRANKKHCIIAALFIRFSLTVYCSTKRSDCEPVSVEKILHGVVSFPYAWVELVFVFLVWCVVASW